MKADTNDTTPVLPPAISKMFSYVAAGLLFSATYSPAFADAGLAMTNPPPVARERKHNSSADPLAHLDYAPGKSPKFWSVAATETVMARWPDFTQAYFNSWTYVNGYELCGFEMLYHATGDKNISITSSVTWISALTWMEIFGRSSIPKARRTGRVSTIWKI